MNHFKKFKIMNLKPWMFREIGKDSHLDLCWPHLKKKRNIKELHLYLYYFELCIWLLSSSLKCELLFNYSYNIYYYYFFFFLYLFFFFLSNTLCSFNMWLGTSYYDPLLIRHAQIKLSIFLVSLIPIIIKQRVRIWLWH